MTQDTTNWVEEMKMDDKEREKLVSRLGRELQGRREIVFAYLYGSFVEGDLFRDIDIALYVNEAQVRKEEFLAYEISMAVELQTLFSKPFDVKILNWLPLGLQYYATTSRLLFGRDDDQRVDFVARVRSLYLDFQIEAQKYLAEVAHG